MCMGFLLKTFENIFLLLNIICSVNRGTWEFNMGVLVL